MSLTQKEMVHLAALADLHTLKSSQGSLQTLLGQLPAEVDILLLCGDLTENGLPEEARVLAKALTESVRVPVIGVLGNHDFQSGKQDEVRQLLSEAGVAILDGDACEVQGIGFAGAKGFLGGFGRGTLSPFGEDSIKSLVQEALQETLKLETALAKLRTATSIVLLHYAPIQATVVGEPLDIYPFLGTSRLEEPLNRFPVTAVFHGHAHHGSLEGKTASNVPVFNVSLPLMRLSNGSHPPFRLLEVPRQETSDHNHSQGQPLVLTEQGQTRPR